MKIDQQRIFISGGAGVIGQELVKLLSKTNATIMVGDLKPRPHQFSKKVIYRRGDLNYLKKEEIELFKPTLFFHLAATFERSNETYDFWEDNFSNNINLSHHLLSIFKDLESIKAVIFASSYLIYDKQLYMTQRPTVDPHVLNEASPINPRNLTGSAKLNHEVELEFIHQFKPNIRIINARIYRSYGKGSRDVISRWIRSALAKQEISVYQSQNMFDYVYAADVALGLIKLAESRFSGIVNLSAGKAISVNDVIKELLRQFPHLKIKRKKGKGLYEASEADLGVLKKATKWTPSTTLSAGIKKIIKYEQSHSVKNETMPRVLITSLSKKVPLIKSLRRAVGELGLEIELIGADIKNGVLGSYFVDQYWKMPSTSDENLDKIINFCQTNHVSMIIPTRDGELSFWAKHKQKLRKNNIKVMVSPLITTQLMLDKLNFYTKTKHFRLPIIETAGELSAIKADSYVVKERYGAGSRSIGLNLSLKKALAHVQQLENPIFQPFVSGKEYSVDAYVDLKRKIKGIVVRRRNLVIAGESQITTTLSHPKIEKIAKKFFNSFKFYGHIVLQVMEDQTGEVHIIECNPRFGGASTASVQAGLETFKWFILESIGESIDIYPFISHHQIKQVRISSDIYL